MSGRHLCVSAVPVAGRGKYKTKRGESTLCYFSYRIIINYFDISYVLCIFVPEVILYHNIVDYLSHELLFAFGEKYKNYRKALGISQKDEHLKTGIAVSTLSLFENGKGQGLSLSNLVSLLKMVGLGDSLLSIIPEIPSLDLEKEWRRSKKK